MGPKITFVEEKEEEMSNQPRFIKLNNGEEIVASVTAKGDKLELKNPVKFMMTHEGLGMMPFFPLCKEGPVLLDMNLVMLTMELDEEIYNAYQSKFGGIVLPTASQTAAANLKLVTE